MNYVMPQMPVTVVCPSCGQESLVVEIEHSGSSPAEFGEAKWFEGFGKCPCGFEGEYSDSSQ